MDWFFAGNGVSDGLAIAVGSYFGKKLPERIVKIVAALIFFLFGIITVIQGNLALPAYSWIFAVLTTFVLALIFFRKPAANNSEIPQTPLNTKERSREHIDVL